MIFKNLEHKHGIWKYVNTFILYKMNHLSHSTKIDPFLKIPCLHYFHSYACFNMLEFS